MNDMNQDKSKSIQQNVDALDVEKLPKNVQKQKNAGVNTGVKLPLASIQAHCPAIVDAINGKDSLLKETAESTLSWIVFGVSGTDLNYAVRAIAEMEEEPVGKLEGAEARFLELKRIVTKARGDSNLDAVAQETLETYATNICTALKSDSEIKRVKKAAEQKLSEALLGRKGADYPFIKKYIADNIQKSEDSLIPAIKTAELNFIDERSLIYSIISEFKNEEEKGGAAVVHSMNRNNQ